MTDINKQMCVCVNVTGMKSDLAERVLTNDIHL